MTKIEEVARAICKAEYGDEDAGWQNQIPAARAAIEAMRVPTDAMRQAGSAVFVEEDGGPRATYTAMIDAALGETE